jgi:hypothetical protein
MLTLVGFLKKKKKGHEFSKVKKRRTYFSRDKGQDVRLALELGGEYDHQKVWARRLVVDLRESRLFIHVHLDGTLSR